MNDYYNDYNKDLYTAQSEDFCKSCYSSGKSRAGCLLVLVLAVAAFFVYKVLEAAFTAKTAAVATVLLALAAFAVRAVLKRKR